jgi:hypothetical protein
MPTTIPRGWDEVNISFKSKVSARQWHNYIRKGRGLTEAEYFDKIVRQIHMLPHKDVLPDYGVTSIVEEHRFGAWKITQVEFKDGSYYNVGQPDQGAQR